MTSYFSKSESEVLKSLKQAAKKIKNQILILRKSFLEKVKAGPFHGCVTCNRCFNYPNVVKLDSEKYDRKFKNKLSTNITSFDGKHYICKTYNAHTKKLKGALPGCYQWPELSEYS